MSIWERMGRDNEKRRQRGVVEREQDEEEEGGRTDGKTHT